MDKDLVNLMDDPEGLTIYRAPATRIAEEMGKRIVANIVMLGALTALGGVIGYESMKKAVIDSIPAGTEDFNISAFDKGYEYGMSLLS
jgi:2-oxoglutarate ferredoxin oxidoreductase subunit gamma